MPGTEGLLGEFAGDAFVREVDEHQVVVGSTTDEVVAALHKSTGHGLGVLDDLLAVRLVTGFQGLAKGQAFALAFGQVFGQAFGLGFGRPSAWPLARLSARPLAKPISLQPGLGLVFAQALG